MPERVPQDDKAIEAALSVIPVRLLLLAEPEEMGVITHRLHARVRQMARPED